MKRKWRASIPEKVSVMPVKRNPGMNSKKCSVSFGETWVTVQTFTKGKLRLMVNVHLCTTYLAKTWTFFTDRMLRNSLNNVISFILTTKLNTFCKSNIPRNISYHFIRKSLFNLGFSAFNLIRNLLLMFNWIFLCMRYYYNYIIIKILL